ncbi:MAG: response regulator [Candidatus Cohnella colombiensis]|uniref:Response regulator n=1 Tax=Candidatus Cohnella colombiensis TaxID=3121368 RepID=A0AA95F1C8_9BACL|nr:MAG: response regulator [Cohnella sp.]
MKVLLIDDEKHVREAIHLLVPWERFGIDTILEASDGSSAIELISTEQPAIIFTDMMMPLLSGKDLLEWTAKHAPTSKIIVISGHDDFDFVRQTVKYGGIDYLLKPLDEDQLLNALTKSIEAWKADEAVRSRDLQLNIEINKLKPIYLDKYFSTLLTDSSEYYSIQETIQQQFGVAEPINAARLCVLSLELASPTIQNKYASCWDLLHFSLTNVCNEFLRQRGNIGYAFRNWGQENEIALLLWSEHDRVEILLHDINEGIHKALNSRFGIGIGPVVEFPIKIADSYRNARKSIRYRNIKQMKKWIQSYDTDQFPIKNSAFFSDYEQRIRYAIQSADDEQVTSALDAWFNAVAQEEWITLEQLHLWLQEFRVARSMWTNGAISDMTDDQHVVQLTTPPVLNDDLCFDQVRWKQHQLDEARSIMKWLSESNSEQITPMQAIAKYIEQFTNEELTLQNISNRFFLSREYISRKFKQEMNENLNDYITRVRIVKAKALLIETPLKISKIAEMVGIHDEKYFSKVFKKQTSYSPNEYRKQSIQKL